MKHYSFLAVIVIMGMICFPLYAEDDVSQNSAGAFTLPPLVFDIYPGYFRETKYLLLDGTYLNFEELRSRLFAVPGNEKYVRRTKGWQIMGIISGSIGLSGLIGTLVIRLVPDIPNKDMWGTVMDCVAITGCAGTLMGTGGMMNNWRRAIKNYNLSVMGIPIP